MPTLAIKYFIIFNITHHLIAQIRIVEGAWGGSGCGASETVDAAEVTICENSNVILQFIDVNFCHIQHRIIHSWTC